MSTSLKGKRYPSHWGPVVAMLLIIGGMTFLIISSWIPTNIKEKLRKFLSDNYKPAK